MSEPERCINCDCLLAACSYARGERSEMAYALCLGMTAARERESRKAMGQMIEQMMGQRFGDVEVTEHASVGVNVFSVDDNKAADELLREAGIDAPAELRRVMLLVARAERAGTITRERDTARAQAAMYRDIARLAIKQRDLSRDALTKRIDWLQRDAAAVHDWVVAAAEAYQNFMEPLQLLGGENLPPDVTQSVERANVTTKKFLDALRAAVARHDAIMVSWGLAKPETPSPDSVLLAEVTQLQSQRQTFEETARHNSCLIGDCNQAIGLATQWRALAVDVLEVLRDFTVMDQSVTAGFEQRMKVIEAAMSTIATPFDWEAKARSEGWLPSSGGEWVDAAEHERALADAERLGRLADERHAKVGELLSRLGKLESGLHAIAEQGEGGGTSKFMATLARRALVCEPEPTTMEEMARDGSGS